MDDPMTTIAATTADNAGRLVLVVHPRGHPVALPLIDHLKTFGIAVRAVPNVYDAVVGLARESRTYAAVVMAVDFFNRDELKFFSVAARRWPDLPTAAVARPAFAFKADMADLAGARAVCADAKEIDRLLVQIGLPTGMAPDPMATASAAEGAEAGDKGAPALRSPDRQPGATTGLPLTDWPVRPEADPPAPPVPPIPDTAPHAETTDRSSAASDDSDSASAAPDRRPPALTRELPTSPHDILTEAEITALLENLDEEDEPDDD